MSAGVRWAGFFLCMAGAASAALPEPTRLVWDIDAGRVDPYTFNFDAAGYWKLQGPAREDWSRSLLFALSGPVEREKSPMVSPSILDPADSCATWRQKRYFFTPFAYVISRSHDADEARRVRSEIDGALAKLDDWLARSVAMARVEGMAPRLAELQRRVVRDQAIHAAVSDARPSAGMSETAARAWQPVVRGRMLAIDCDNTVWLKAQIAEVGWFDIGKFGADADAGAWRLLNHSLRDEDFQRRTLTQLRALPAGATSSLSLACLTERFAAIDLPASAPRPAGPPDCPEPPR